MTNQWYTGNTADDGDERRGWILGHFVDPSEGVRHSKDVDTRVGLGGPSGVPPTPHHTSLSEVEEPAQQAIARGLASTGARGGARAAGPVRAG